MKKITSLLLALSLAFCVLLAPPRNVSAAGTETQDGLEASITTDKAEYTADEDIQVSVNIKNDNPYRVEDVSVETLLPEGLVLKTGNLSAADIDIEAGASYSVSAVAQLSEDEKETKPDDTTKPADTAQSGDTAKPADTDQSGDTTKPEDTANSGGNDQDTNSPQTGDNSNIVLWVVLFIAFAVGIILTFKFKFKKTAMILSLFLCFATVLAMLSMSVTTENITEITVDKTITVNGKEYTIVSKVKKPINNMPETSSTEDSGSTKPETSSTEDSDSKKPEPENFGNASNTMPEDYSTEPVPFKDEIDEFNRQVKEFPRESFDPIDLYDHCEREGLFSARKLEIDGIHFYEVKPNDDEPKPLVILVHGGGWHKDFSYAYDLAKSSGLCMVLIDAAAHGESKAGPLQGPAVWMETVKYIDTLIEYYNTRPDVDAAKFGVTGFSMGGNITEYYVVYGKYKPAAVCIEGATADATGEFSAAAVHDKGGGRPLYSVWSEEKLWPFTSATAPMNFPEYFKDIPVFICAGALDDTHSVKTMEIFKDKIEALGNDQVVFHCYEDAGHEVPASWEENEQRQFYEMLKN